MNRQCPICLGYELDDGTSDIKLCFCEDDDDSRIVECANDCGQTVYDGGFCSCKCREEYEIDHGQL